MQSPLCTRSSRTEIRTSSCPVGSGRQTLSLFARGPRPFPLASPPPKERSRLAPPRASPGAPRGLSGSPTLSAGFLRRPAPVTRADSAAASESLRLTSPCSRLLGHRARVSFPAPAAVQWKPGPALPFGLSLLSASQSARRSGIRTETCGWSRRTGHAQAVRFLGLK